MYRVRLPGILNQSLRPLQVADGTLCRMPAPLPGMAGIAERLGSAIMVGGPVPRRVLRESPERRDPMEWSIFYCGKDMIGTGLPSFFRLNLAGMIFSINNHAMRLLADYLRDEAEEAGEKPGQITFSLDSLAAGIESVVAAGLLSPLLDGYVWRLGTEDKPLLTPSWKFSFEFIGGFIEVSLALPRSSEDAL